MVSDEVYLKIIDFFTNTPPKSDDDVHEFAKKINVDTDDLEQGIYDILATFLSGGLFNKSPETKIDPEQFAMGTKVEFEHLNTDANPVIVKALAERISKDHLTELKDYYTSLEHMERNSKENDEEIIASVIKNVRV